MREQGAATATPSIMASKCITVGTRGMRYSRSQIKDRGQNGKDDQPFLSDDGAPEPG